MIKFNAQSYTKVGDLIRAFHNGTKFWKVTKIVAGVAYAKPAKQVNVTGCC